LSIAIAQRVAKIFRERQIPLRKRVAVVGADVGDRPEDATASEKRDRHKRPDLECAQNREVLRRPARRDQHLVGYRKHDLAAPGTHDRWHAERIVPLRRPAREQLVCEGLLRGIRMDDGETGHFFTVDQIHHAPRTEVGQRHPSHARQRLFYIERLAEQASGGDEEGKVRLSHRLLGESRSSARRCERFFVGGAGIRRSVHVLGSRFRTRGRGFVDLDA